MDIQVDIVSFLGFISGAFLIGLGLGYKYCPKTTIIHKEIQDIKTKENPKPKTITKIKKYCSTYKQYKNSKYSQRFTVILSDEIPITNNCPQLLKKTCQFTNQKCPLLM